MTTDYFTLAVELAKRYQREDPACHVEVELTHGRASYARAVAQVLEDGRLLIVAIDGLVPRCWTQYGPRAWRQATVYRGDQGIVSELVSSGSGLQSARGDCRL